MKGAGNTIPNNQESETNASSGINLSPDDGCHGMISIILAQFIVNAGVMVIIGGEIVHRAGPI